MQGHRRLRARRGTPCSNFSDPFFAFERFVNIQHFDERCVLSRPWVDPWSVRIRFQGLPHMQPAPRSAASHLSPQAFSLFPPHIIFLFIIFNYFSFLSHLPPPPPDSPSFHSQFSLFLLMPHFPCFISLFCSSSSHCFHILISLILYSSVCSVLVYIFIVLLSFSFAFFQSFFSPSDTLLSSVIFFLSIYFYLLIFLLLLLLLSVFLLSILYTLLFTFFVLFYFPILLFVLPVHFLYLISLHV